MAPSLAISGAPSMGLFWREASIAKFRLGPPCCQRLQHPQLAVVLPTLVQQGRWCSPSALVIAYEKPSHHPIFIRLCIIIVFDRYIYIFVAALFLYSIIFL